MVLNLAQAMQPRMAKDTLSMTTPSSWSKTLTRVLLYVQLSNLTMAQCCITMPPLLILASKSHGDNAGIKCNISKTYHTVICCIKYDMLQHQ